MSESQKVSLTERAPVFKCIYCHELLRTNDGSFKTCEGCSACIHIECDTTGICLIPGCGLKLQPERNTAAISPEKPSDYRPYQDRLVTTPEQPLEPFRYPKVDGLGFLTKVWLLFAGPVYLIWLFSTSFPLAIHKLAAHRLGVIGGAVAIAFISIFIEHSYRRKE